jgi:peptide/nickel transport system substrate-binding protein
MTLAESAEILNLPAIAGEVDCQNFNLSLSKLPVFVENEKKGDYIVSLHPGDYCGFIIKFNMDYGLKDPEIGKWFDNADFRRALSVAIDRDQINEMFWMGTGEPSAAVAPAQVPYSPGPEYQKMWATYDPKKAMELLDKIGLDKKDADGFRLRSDGKGRLRLTITVASPTHAAYEQWTEPIVEFWKKVGIDAKMEALERSLATTRGGANETMLSAWNNDGTEHLWSFPFHATWLSIATLAPAGPETAKWYNSAGAEGRAPSGKLKEVMDKWLSGLGATQEQRIKIGKEFWAMHADQVFIIGIIGSGPDSGIRVHKTKLGNVATRMYVGPEDKGESIVRPVTYYWKS